MMLRRVLLYIFFLIPFVISAQNPVLEKRMNNALLDAVEKINSEDYAGALKILKHIEEVEPANDAVAFYLGRCLYALGNDEDSVPYLQKAYQLDTANITYTELLAEAYLATGRHSDASGLLAKLYEANPAMFSSPYILCVMGQRALEENNDSLAQTRYEEALEQSPDYAPAQLGLIDVARMRGSLPSFIAAVTAFVKNDALNTDDRLPYLKQITQAIDQNIFDAWSVQLDYMVDFLAEDTRRTAQSLEFAAQWYYGTGRKQEGRDYFNLWAECYPDDYDAQSIQMQFCVMDNDMYGAIRKCRLLETLAKGDKEKLIEVYTVLGDCYHSLGDDDRCFSYYQKALKIDPEYAPVLNNYAYFLAINGKSLTKAARMSKVAVEKDPENASYLDTYGWILFLQGKLEEAKGYFKKAMVFGGRDSEVVLEHYSLVLRALGDESTADYYHSLSQKKAAEQ